MLRKSYKISYEVAEVSLPPKISRDIERQLRISTDRIKKDNADNLNEATVALITASTNTVFDVVSGDKNFDEASRVPASQAGGAVKTIIIERGRQVAIDEGKRIVKEFAGQATQKIIRQIGGKNNPVLNAIAFGDIVKDLAFDWADGKISDEQFVKLVVRRCTVLALQSFSASLSGGVFASVAMEVIANGLDKILQNFGGQVAFSNREEFRRDFRQRKNSFELVGGILWFLK